MSIRTPIANVKHLGSAKSGTSHHIKQRVTAIFMAPLLIWFVLTVIMFIRTPLEGLPWYISSPWVIIGAILFVMNYIYHGMLGFQMIIEDYISNKWMRTFTLITLFAVCLVTLVAGLVAVFSIYILSRIG